MAVTVLQDDETGVGALRIRHPPGTFALTPANRITMAAVGASRGRLRGTGIDWGTGVGCVALAAARLPAVDGVIGLEIDEDAVRVARQNAVDNGLADAVRFFVADGYRPATTEARRALARLEGRAGFVVANPPATVDGDGFGWRRVVAAGAIAYLEPGGVLLVQISSQYGMDRVLSLASEGPGLRHDGVAASTDWVPFDQGRPHLRRNLATYAAAEASGAGGYVFRWPGEAGEIGAGEALSRHRETGRSPLSRWQVHRFVYEPA